MKKLLLTFAHEMSISAKELNFNRRELVKNPSQWPHHINVQLALQGRYKKVLDR